MKNILIKGLIIVGLMLGTTACAGWNINPGINITGGPHGVRVVPNMEVDMWGKPL